MNRRCRVSVTDRAEDKETPAEILRNAGEFAYISRPGSLLTPGIELLFFRQLGVRYSCAAADEDVAGRTVVYGGRAEWNRQDDLRESERELARMRRAARVIMLPGSYDHCDALLQVMDGRFTVFCREEQSLRYVRSACTGAQVLPADDFAAMYALLSREPKAYPQTTVAVQALDSLLLAAPTAPVIYVLRRDVESRGSHVDPAASVDLSVALKDEYCSEETLLNLAQFFVGMLGTYRCIVTDDADTAFAALYTGRHVYLLGTRSSLNSVLYAHYFVHDPRVRLVADVPHRGIPSTDAPQPLAFPPYVAGVRSRILRRINALWTEC